MSQINKYTVRMGDDGTPLVDFLADRLKCSKRRAKLLLDSRNVFVNRRRVWMAHHRLAAGDAVEIPEVAPPRPAPEKIALLYSDGDYVIANKPPGILSDGADSVEERLSAQMGSTFLAAVHRLDRDTSGCLLLARNRRALERMIPLFRQFMVTKVYDAIVSGRTPFRQKTVSSPVDGHPAVTRVTVLDSTDMATHIRAEIDTGRTHQIRIHMRSTGHAVLGDRQYATSRHATDFSMLVQRQMLHARLLQFEHPDTSRRIRVEASLPHDFRTCLKSLGLR